jgi:hypothetical protein
MAVVGRLTLMIDLIIELIIFIILPFVLGRLLTTQPTVLVRLMTTHISIRDMGSCRSRIEENVYWARTNPEIWAQKHPAQVQLLKLGGYICYFFAGMSLMYMLGNIFSFII